MAALDEYDDNHWEQYTELVARTYGHDIDRLGARMTRVRPSAIARFEIEDGRVAAGALALPCSQYFGGRPVPAACITTPCVAPHHRGRGRGRQLMWALADRIGSEGLAVAPTYARAPGFLRSVGWETCGQSVRYEAFADAFATGDVVPGTLGEPDPESVEELRRRIACAWSGPVERPTWWATTEDGPDTIRVGWQDGDRLSGYLAYRAVHDGEVGRVVVSDLWAESRDALDGLLHVLATARPTSPTIEFEHGVLAPDTPVRYRMNGPLTPLGARDWMLRVIDPAGALAASGWPTFPGVLEIEVAALGRASSMMRIEFADGTATVTPADTARVRMSTGAFSAWYCGSLPATMAAQLGNASGPAEDLAFMDLLTADRRPWLPDRF